MGRSFGNCERITRKNLIPEDKIKYLEGAIKSQTLILSISEIIEAQEADRKDRYAHVDKFEDYLKLEREKLEEGNRSNIDSLMETEYKRAYEAFIKDRFESELAGTFIRLLDICHGYKIDIEYFIRMELEYNKLRGKKHGKNF